MKTFNKYKFIENLKEEISNELSYNYSKGMDIDEEMIREQIYSSIENQCIYSYDAWAIAYELSETDFANPITGGTCKNIYELAYYSLLEYTENEIDVYDIIETFETENEIK